MSGAVTHVGSEPATYLARVVKVQGPGSFTFSPSTMEFDLGPVESINIDFSVTALAGNDATTSSRLKLKVKAEIFYHDTQDVCLVPSSITTSFDGFVGIISKWEHLMEPTSTDFQGRIVTEIDTPGTDGCFTLNPPDPGVACTEITSNSGLSAAVSSTNKISDIIGYDVGCADWYVAELLVDPFAAKCRANWPQPFEIDCPMMSNPRLFWDTLPDIGPEATDTTIGAWSGSKHETQTHP